MDAVKKQDKEITQLKIKGFVIHDAGEPSVGIWGDVFNITSRDHFYFESKEDLKEFKDKLRTAFELVCHEVTTIYTFEEIEKLNKEVHNGRI